MKNGVPFDVAFSVDDLTRAAWSIMFYEMEGHTFNFRTMEFEKPRS